MEQTAVEETGMAWAIPEDGRSSLTLSLRGLKLERVETSGAFRWLPCDSSDSHTRSNILATLKRLGDFDRRLHMSKNRSFSVTDYDPWNFEKITYRYRKRPIRHFHLLVEGTWGKLLWDTQDSVPMACAGGSSQKEIFRPLSLLKMPQFETEDRNFRRFSSSHVPLMFTAPWRRLIFIKGLASIAPSKLDGTGLSDCPYLDERMDWDPRSQDVDYAESLKADSSLTIAIRSHLSAQHTPGNASSNPYSIDQPFHITFFEKLEGDLDTLKESQWKIGNLFEDGVASGTPTQHLRRSAFTITALSKPSYSYNGCRYNRRMVDKGLDPFYTVLLLVPEGFELTRDEETQEEVLEQCTAFQAELFCIIGGLAEVIKRWSRLDEYLGGLIVEDFMNPKQYSTLLFDDENFTRSRKYFWTIGCLNEFIASVSDNIKQWDMYHEARIKEVLADDNMIERLNTASVLPFEHIKRAKVEMEVRNGAAELSHIERMVQTGVSHRETLTDIKTQFENKLETVKSLRDGLFNASALVESRASTRLGENVKLLTYVSIFYLPLAFCASLWAVPNIESHSTKIPFIVTAIVIGAVTYAIVFNLDSITHQFSRHYFRARDKLVKEMQEEHGWWRTTGVRFEEFKPVGENRVPTEWLIPVYGIRRLIRRRRRRQVDIREKSTTVKKVGVKGPQEVVIDEKSNETLDYTRKADKNTPGLFSRLLGRRSKDTSITV